MSYKANFWSGEQIAVEKISQQESVITLCHNKKRLKRMS